MHKELQEDEVRECCGGPVIVQPKNFPEEKCYVEYRCKIIGGEVACQALLTIKRLFLSKDRAEDVLEKRWWHRQFFWHTALPVGGFFSLSFVFLVVAHLSKDITLVVVSYVALTLALFFVLFAGHVYQKRDDEYYKRKCDYFVRTLSSLREFERKQVYGFLTLLSEIQGIPQFNQTKELRVAAKMLLKQLYKRAW